MGAGTPAPSLTLLGKALAWPSGRGACWKGLAPASGQLSADLPDLLPPTPRHRILRRPQTGQFRVSEQEPRALHKRALVSRRPLEGALGIKNLLPIPQWESTCRSPGFSPGTPAPSTFPKRVRVLSTTTQLEQFISSTWRGCSQRIPRYLRSHETHPPHAGAGPRGSVAGRLRLCLSSLSTRETRYHAHGWPPLLPHSQFLA